MPSSTAKVIALSAVPYCRAAETTPAATPRTEQRTKATPASSSVAWNRSHTSSRTGRFSENERPKSPVSMLPEPDEIPYHQRLIEPEVAVDPLDILGRRISAEDRRRRIARDHRHDQEDDDRQSQHHGDRRDQAAEDVASHPLSPLVAAGAPAAPNGG